MFCIACNSIAWFSENFNVVDGRVLAARAEYNPLIKYAQRAVDLHENNNKFLLTKDILLDGKPARDVLLEVAEKDSKKSISKKRVLDLGQLTTHNVPTDCFSDDKGIVYLAQGKEVANQYGLFLRNNAEIQEVTFCLPEVRTEDYSIALWLRRIGCGWSAFDGGDRDLGGVSGSLFGIVLANRTFFMNNEHPYQEVFSISNLVKSWKKARKGKTKKNYVIKFEENLVNNLLKLHEELSNILNITSNSIRSHIKGNKSGTLSLKKMGFVKNKGRSHFNGGIWRLQRMD